MTQKNEKQMVKTIVDLWYEAQMGPMKRCQEKQHELDSLMWRLHKEFYPELEDNGVL